MTRWMTCPGCCYTSALGLPPGAGKQIWVGVAQARVAGRPWGTVQIDHAGRTVLMAPAGCMESHKGTELLGQGPAGSARLGTR